MTWFKVDDGLHAHRKAIRAGVPAMGLWVLAGSWASDQLTDGWVPDYIAVRLDPGQAEKHAAALVRAGLWIPDEHDGERGWWFHEWSDHQPSAKSIHDQRAAAKERMARVREERRRRDALDKGSKEQAIDDPFGECSREQPANVPENFGRSTSTPTRPDPTRSKEQEHDQSPRDRSHLSVVPDEPVADQNTGKASAAKPAADPGSSREPELPMELPPANETKVAKPRKRKPKTDGMPPRKPGSNRYDYSSDPNFNHFYDDIYPRKVGKSKAWVAWQAALDRGADPEHIMRAAQAYRDDRTRNPQYTKHPEFWLNEERYNDLPPERPRGFAAGAFWDN